MNHEWSYKGEPVKFEVATPTICFKLKRDSQEPSGQLLIGNDGKLEFKGDVEESAKAFFDYLCANFRLNVVGTIKPLRVGEGVTIENLGYASSSDKERKPYLVFSPNGDLQEVNLVNVSLVEKRPHTIKELQAIGVQVIVDAQ